MNHMDKINTNSHLLPNDLRVALSAINTDEVQLMIRRLAKFNLGVCMPHFHPTEDGLTSNRFLPLPQDVASLEQNGCVSFVATAALNESVHNIPTAWRWDDRDDSVKVISGCTYSCNDLTGK